MEEEREARAVGAFEERFASAHIGVESDCPGRGDRQHQEFEKTEGFRVGLQMSAYRAETGEGGTPPLPVSPSPNGDINGNPCTGFAV